MTFDARIDRTTLGEPEDLPLLILDRMHWDGADEEALRRDRTR